MERSTRTGGPHTLNGAGPGRLQSRALEEFRTLYTSEVVVPAQKMGLLVKHDYQSVDGAIPLPATLSMALGNRLAEDEGGNGARLYSPYPFPWRQETGIRALYWPTRRRCTRFSLTLLRTLLWPSGVRTEKLN